MIPAKVPDGDPITLAPDETSAPVERDWLTTLASTGRDRDVALRDLHRLLLGAARHQVWRMRGLLPALGPESLEDLANCAADDALTILLGKVGTFQGRSRFTTWAYKFAILQAANEVRRQAWSVREVELRDDAPDSRGAGPEAIAEATDLAQAVRLAMHVALTGYQRRIAIALLVDEVPIDVLADRLGTTRGALYKTLHVARSRIRAHLIASGHLQPNPTSRGVS
ncbi:MAG TPA: sigma-70 family RNA polymerase sigma factor [Intrasporangium sp.]|uniref:RNA polymerase sigma factor n=1 Tax=Intrasporangium sp. TaxID=1925024 RepID=UPI002B46D824|nr:sigma-70 family RNA polymerase sigma factor [Intrasporangium sp.]HKX67770.1 sigma-70 family RNA polymerase sigma factor [Intrasporangium sp.]